MCQLNPHQRSVWNLEVSETLNRDKIEAFWSILRFSTLFLMAHQKKRKHELRLVWLHWVRFEKIIEKLSFFEVVRMQLFFTGFQSRFFIKNQRQKTIKRNNHQSSQTNAKWLNCNQSESNLISKLPRVRLNGLKSNRSEFWRSLVIPPVPPWASESVEVERPRRDYKYHTLLVEVSGSSMLLLDVHGKNCLYVYIYICR